MAKALEEAGCPGIQPARDEADELLRGWRVDFTWPPKPTIAAKTTTRGIPVAHLGSGTWRTTWYWPDKVLFARRSRDWYECATLMSRHFYHGYSRDEWRTTRIGDFTRSAFRDELDYDVRYSPYGGELTVPMAEFTRPEDYEPLARSIARQAMAAFQALLPPGQ